MISGLMKRWENTGVKQASCLFEGTFGEGEYVEKFGCQGKRGTFVELPKDISFLKTTIAILERSHHGECLFKTLPGYTILSFLELNLTQNISIHNLSANLLSEIVPRTIPVRRSR